MHEAWEKIRVGVRGSSRVLNSSSAWEDKEFNIYSLECHLTAATVDLTSSFVSQAQVRTKPDTSFDLFV